MSKKSTLFNLDKPRKTKDGLQLPNYAEQRIYKPYDFGRFGILRNSYRSCTEDIPQVIDPETKKELDEFLENINND